MKVITTNIAGILLLKPDVYKDQRGFFIETYTEEKYLQEGIEKRFVQDNYSHSKRNVLRGLHYQLKKPQGKLVRVVKGAVFDVALDIRLSSPTFGCYFSTILDDQDFHQLYLPPGIAHGFSVISETADFEYKCTDYYNPGDEGGILWNDSDLDIKWPVKNPILSPSDQSFPCLSAIAREELPG